MPKQGDIVLLPIPFIDLSSQKRRPVIVISNDVYNRTGLDVVVVAMTSNPILDAYSFAITTNDLARRQLNRPATVRVAKIYTLSQALIVKTFGQVNTQVLVHIRGLLRDLAAKRP